MKDKCYSTLIRMGIALVFASLTACGGNSSNNGNSNARSLEENSADITNKACVATRDATAEQTLDVYIAALTTLADKGSACAQYGIGMLYKTGYGDVQKDPAKYRDYIARAADQEYPGALREAKRFQ